jgi:AraC family transcriptional regulator
MTVLLERRDLTVIDYRCRRQASDSSFEEVHACHSLSYVRRGSFGCHALGAHFELAAGSFFVGFPGDAFTRTHGHHDGGDECLSFQFSPELADKIGAGGEAWRRVAVPPIAPLAMLGSLAQSIADGLTDLGLDEVGMMLAARFVDLMRGERRRPVRTTSRDRPRCVTAALCRFVWITDVLPDAAAERICPLMNAGVTALKQSLEERRDTA